MPFLVDNVFQFGKHKGLSINEVSEKFPRYLSWLSNQPWARADPSLSIHLKSEPVLDPAMIKFGKYKGKTVSQIFSFDPNYIEWLRENEFVQKNCKYITDQIEELDQIIMES